MSWTKSKEPDVWSKDYPKPEPTPSVKYPTHSFTCEQTAHMNSIEDESERRKVYDSYIASNKL